MHAINHLWVSDGYILFSFYYLQYFSESVKFSVNKLTPDIETITFWQQTETI